MRRYLAGIALGSVLLSGCTATPGNSSGPSTSISAEKNDWDRLEAEEISDPAPLSEARFGTPETAGLMNIQISGIHAETKSTVYLSSGIEGKEMQSVTSMQGGQLLVVDLNVSNDSATNVYPYAMNTSRFVLVAESRENIVLARAEQDSHRLGAYWDPNEALKPGETAEYQFFFDIPAGQEPAYVTLIDEPKRLGYPLRLKDLAARLGLSS